MLLLEIRTQMVHPNSCGIYLVIHMYWTIYMSFIHLPGWGKGIRSLSQIGLAESRLEVLCAEVGVSACLVGSEASDHFLHLLLCWNIIVNIERVNVGVHWSERGVRGPLMVEGCVVLGNLSHFGPRSVGRPGG